MKVNAVFLHMDGSRSSQLITIGESFIEINDRIYKWSQLNIRLSGNRNNLLYFENDSMSFYIRVNKELMTFLKGIEHLELQKILKKKRSNLSLEVGLILIIIVTFFGMFGSIYFFKNPLSQMIVEKIPYEYEKIIGEKLSGFGISSAGGKVLNPELEEELKILIAPLIEELPQKYKDIKLSVTSSSDINAFAMPGGYISFNLGLLKEAKSCEEILGVAAHEIAHITNRHVLTGLVQTLSIYAIVGLFFGDVSGIIAVLSESGSALMRLSFSRDIETQADEEGLRLLAKAGYDESGLISFFNILKNNRKKESSNETAVMERFLSTHPVTDDRIAHIKMFAKKMQIKQSNTKCNINKIKEHLRIKK